MAKHAAARLVQNEVAERPVAGDEAFAQSRGLPKSSVSLTGSRFALVKLVLMEARKITAVYYVCPVLTPGKRLSIHHLRTPAWDDF